MFRLLPRKGWIDSCVLQIGETGSWHAQADKRSQPAASTPAGVLVVSCPGSLGSLLTVLPSFLTLLPYSLLYTVSRFIF